MLVVLLNGCLGFCVIPGRSYIQLWQHQSTTTSAKQLADETDFLRQSREIGWEDFKIVCEMSYNGLSRTLLSSSGNDLSELSVRVYSRCLD